MRAPAGARALEPFNLFATQDVVDAQGKSVVQVKLSLELSATALRVLRSAHRPRVVIVTGGSGQGKSTFLNHIALGKRYFREQDRNRRSTYECYGPFTARSSTDSCTRGIEMLGPISLKALKLLYELEPEEEEAVNEEEEEEEEASSPNVTRPAGVRDPADCDIFLVDTEGTGSIDHVNRSHLLLGLIAASSIATVRICCVSGRGPEAVLDDYIAITRLRPL
jgi:hypothetical protein